MFYLNGNAILLSDLWKDRKAVVAFARHFGYLYYPLYFHFMLNRLQHLWAN